MKEKIKKYLIEVCHMNAETVANLQLSKLLSFVEMKDMVKYNEFKMGLRKEGWII